MKKKILSMAMAAALGVSGITPVMAADEIVIPGDVIYTQDFEDVSKIEESMTTAIGTSGSFGLSVVDEGDGNSALQVAGYGAYGFNNFGPEYTDAVVSADVKLLQANGNNVSYFGIGTRTLYKSKAYYSNIATFFDIYTPASGAVRDRLAITTGASAAGNKFDSIDKVSDKVSGALITNERKFSDYYTMEAAIVGSTMCNTLSDLNGNVLDSISSTITPTTDGAGTTTLRSHGATLLVDNIEIRELAKLSSFTATAGNNAIAVGGSAAISVSGGDVEIDKDLVRYSYDNSALSIEDGVVTVLAAGEHTVTAYIDDIMSDKSLSSTFMVEGVSADEKLDVVVDDPTLTYGESTAIKVISGGKDVTADAIYSSNVTYADGKITPNAKGLLNVVVAYSGQSAVVPVAVNDTSVKVTETSDTPVFTEDFEGDNATLVSKYANGNSNISVTSVTNSNDSTTSNALHFANIQASTSTFGPSDLTDYTLKYDFYCPTPKGSSASFVGATMRANSTNGGYKLGYTPVMKYNSSTHMVDSSLSAANNRQLTIAYGGSNGIDKWYFGGFSGSSLQSSLMTGYWFTSVNTISGDTISTEIIRRDTNKSVASYETTLNALSAGGSAASGATALSASQNFVYFDNVKIYAPLAYTDIAVKYTETEGTIPFTVVGLDANGSEGTLTGTVSVATTGDVTATNSSFTPGEGLGYVTITYTDAAGTSKYAVIRVGDVEEAPVVPAEPTVTLDKNIRWASTVDNMVASDADNTLTVDGEVVYGIKVTFNANDTATYTEANIAAGESSADVVLPSQVSGASDVVFYIISNADVDSVTLK